MKVGYIVHYEWQATMSKVATLVALAAALTGGACSVAHADDLTGLAVEDLLRLDVVQITVPDAHYHFEGDWMIGYSNQTTIWNGLGSGTSGVNNATQVFPQYMMAETDMEMNMQMIMLMYGVRDDWTVSAMIPHENMVMNAILPNGQKAQNITAGLGDISLALIHPLKYHYPNQVEVELGVGFPTGDIDNFGLVNGMFGPQKLPYNMQLGTGSYQLEPAVTFLSQTSKMAWGAQARAYIPMDVNADGWEAPDRFGVTAWVAPRHDILIKNLTPSFRLDYQTWGNIRGADPLIDFTMMPSSNPSNYAGTRADAFVGLNYSFDQDGKGHGQWLTLEWGAPFYQNLTGIQVKTASMYTGAIEWTFK